MSDLILEGIEKTGYVILCLNFKCKNGPYGKTVLKDDEFYTCGGDCQSCSVPQVLKLLKEVYERD